MTAFVCALDFDGDVRLETNGRGSAKTNLACHRPQGLRFLPRKWLYFETGDPPSRLAKNDDLDRHHMGLVDQVGSHPCLDVVLLSLAKAFPI